eukprot:gene10431-7415_t
MALTNSSLEYLSPLYVNNSAVLDHDDHQLSQHLTKMISKQISDKVVAKEVSREIPNKLSASIKVGDFVSLLECPTLTLEKAASVDDAISLEKCLGDKSWGRVGVVVAKKDAKTSTVKELFSGHRADYLDQELAFADGSPFKYKTLDPDDRPSGLSSGDASNLGHLVALLEEACAELGYTIQQMNSFLSSGTLPSQVLDLVWSKNGGSDSGVSLAQVTSTLQKQLPGLLVKVRAILRQMKEEKTAEEQRKQEKLKKMGLCCMGFEWLKVEGGYRCVGNVHYCSDADMEAQSS